LFITRRKCTSPRGRFQNIRCCTGRSRARGYDSSAEEFNISDLEKLYKKINVFMINNGWICERNTVDGDINELTAIFSRSMFDKVNFEVAMRLHRRG